MSLDKDVKFPELKFVIRGDDINTIRSVLSLAVGHFMLKEDGQKIGIQAGNNFNFVWKLTDETDRKNNE
jgi:hypothetical protein